jgi:hypothetical protein
MTPPKTASLRFCILLACGFSFAHADSGGVIKGRVVDGHQKPLLNSIVTIVEVEKGSRVLSTPLRQAKTDEHGSFEFSDVPYGRYKIFAKNEEMGYPDTYWTFYSGGSFQMVRVSPSSKIAETELRLGPRAATVSGTIEDRGNAEPLIASIRVSRAGDPDAWIAIGASGSFKLLIPPDVDVLLQVRSKGHADWYYPGTTEVMQEKALRLHPGKELHLPIKMNVLHQ